MGVEHQMKKEKDRQLTTTPKRRIWPSKIMKRITVTQKSENKNEGWDHRKRVGRTSNMRKAKSLRRACQKYHHNKGAGER